MADKRGRPPAPLASYRLPPGHHGLPRELVAENQRWRLLGAAAEALAEHGYAKTTTREIATRAGVSSNTFYKFFDGLPECVTAAHQIAVDCVWEAVRGACEERASRLQQLGAAIDAALAFAASEPALAQLLGPELLAAVEQVAIARERLIERLAGLLRGGSAAAVAAEPPLVEQQQIAAALAIVVDRLEAGRSESLTELAPQLVELLLCREKRDQFPAKAIG